MPASPAPRIALVLPGGGARGAYQAGVLARLGEAMGSFAPSIITGVSAGAINAAFVACHPGALGESGVALEALWSQLTTRQVLRVDRRRLLSNVVRWGAQLLSGGAGGATVDALLDNSPLRRLLLEHLRVDTGGWLTGVADKLASRRLEALAITATNYGSGRAETFVESSLDASSQVWSRAYRVGRPARLSVDHVMASSAIPVLFPPVELGGCWYGDGGVRQTAPLSPALRLGADRMLVISTTRGPADVPDGPYPRPSVARVLGVVANALLNDHSEYDAAHLARISRLLQASPQSTWGQLRPVSLLYIRPSQDLGALAAAHEATLPLALRHLLRGWSGSRAQSSDLLSTVLFEGAYTRELIACGRRDAEAHLDRVLELIGPSVLAL